MQLSKKNKRKLSVVGGTLLIIIIIIFAVKLMTNDAPKTQNSEVQTREVFVKTITVQPQNFTPTISTTGQVFAKNKVEVYADVTGTLLKTSKPFKTGIAFKKGETLLQIDSKERRLIVESSKADYFSQLVSLLPDIQQDYPESFEQWKNYVDNFTVSKPIKPLPEPKSEKEKFFLASRKITFQYLSIKSSEVNLQKYRITAPFNGVVLSGNQNPGSLLRNGQKLGEFTALGFFEVKLDISTDQINDIKIGSAININIDSHNMQLNSKVSRIGKAVDKNTQTVTVYADVKDKKVLKDGLFINIEIELPKIKDAFLIDKKYLNEKNQLLQVIDGRLHLLSTKIVAYNDNQAVLTGVPAETVIVNQLLPDAYEGMKVTINQDESL